MTILVLIGAASAAMLLTGCALILWLLEQRRHDRAGFLPDEVFEGFKRGAP